MNPQKAQQLMTEAMEAMISCGRFKATQVAAVRTLVAGMHEEVACIFFGSEAALEAMVSRVTEMSPAERFASSAAHEVITRARTQPAQE